MAINRPKIKKSNAGRKAKAYEQNIQELLSKYFTPEQRRAVLESVIECAVKHKQLEAVKLLWSYTYGKPLETLNLQGGLAVKVIYDKRSD